MFGIYLSVYHRVYRFVNTHQTSYKNGCMRGYVNYTARMLISKVINSPLLISGSLFPVCGMTYRLKSLRTSYLELEFTCQPTSLPPHLFPNSGEMEKNRVTKLTSR